MHKNIFTYILIALFLFSFAQVSQAATPSTTRNIFFPTDTSVSFSDDFGDARSGHLHEANDLVGKKMMPLYAAVDGRIRNVVDPEASYGYAITLEDADGYTYGYLHVNNDTPGTDDGQGGTEHAYAPGIVRGAYVTRGQLIGWMGDSGNAEEISAHLHFEIRQPDRTAIDPYASLTAALYANSYIVSAALKASPDINTDKGLVASTTTPPCVSGSLIKTPKVSAVYYCGADGKRHTFTNDKLYFTWYTNFSNILSLSAEALAAVPLGSNVTYRPGAKLVKMQTSSRIYAVGQNGLLRWIGSNDLAAKLYGFNWNTKVDEISDAFFNDYQIGTPVSTAL